MRISIEPEEYLPPRHGLMLLRVLALAMFCLLALRFWHLQILQGEQNVQGAYANRWRVRSIAANRGLVLDAGGDILAENRPAYAVALVREDCRDIPSTLAKISEWTGEPLSRLQRIYNTSLLERLPSFSPLILARNVRFEQVARIESRLVNWPGVLVLAGQRRFYPYGDLFAHVLGYVGMAGARELESRPALARGDSVGKQGLEFLLEDRLRGLKGRESLEVDALGRSLLRMENEPPRGGEDLRLSLDVNVQRAAAAALGERSGCVVVMEPESGRLLALATSPSYDNNLFTGRLSPATWAALRDDERRPLHNRAIQSVYPPGSIWKLLMAAMFLREGVKPEESVLCTGEYRLAGRVFRCWRDRGHGRVNMTRSLSQSCDVYYYHMADRLGIDKLTAFAQACGFGGLTGIDLPSEKVGVVPGKEWKAAARGEAWQRGETINAAIGQGYTLVTPVRMAVYVSSLLNGGRLLKPLLLANAPPELKGLTPSTEEERSFILRAMRLAVEDAQGTARRLRRADALMGGKTGTAQVVSLGEVRTRLEDTRYEHRDHAWLVSWGIKEDKRYVVVVMVEHGGGGGAMAAPVARAVYEHLFAPGGAAGARRPPVGRAARSGPEEERDLEEILEAGAAWGPFINLSAGANP